jgi:hypothetical protein
MKVLFLVLLLANVGMILIAIFAGSGGPAAPHPELNPEKVRVLGPDDHQRTEDKGRNTEAEAR